MASLLGYTLRDISVFDGMSGKGFSATLYQGYTLVAYILDNANYKPLTVRITTKPEARALAQKIEGAMNRLKEAFASQVQPGSLLDWWSSSSFAAMEGMAQLLMQLRAFEHQSKYAILANEEEQHYGVLAYGPSWLDALDPGEVRRTSPMEYMRASNLGTDSAAAEDKFTQMFIEKCSKAHPNGYNAMAIFDFPFKWDLDVEELAALFTRGGATI